MILGIGSDLTDIRRIEATLARFGDRFLQRQLCRRCKAGEQIVPDGNCLVAAAERSERDPFVDKRPCLPRAAVCLYRN